MVAGCFGRAQSAFITPNWIWFRFLRHLQTSASLNAVSISNPKIACWTNEFVRGPISTFYFMPATWHHMHYCSSFSWVCFWPSFCRGAWIRIRPVTAVLSSSNTADLSIDCSKYFCFCFLEFVDCKVCFLQKLSLFVCNFCWNCQLALHCMSYPHLGLLHSTWRNRDHAGNCASHYCLFRWRRQPSWSTAPPWISWQPQYSA